VLIAAIAWTTLATVPGAPNQCIKTVLILRPDQLDFLFRPGVRHGILATILPAAERGE
jgi:hypothetical protein